MNNVRIKQVAIILIITIIAILFIWISGKTSGIHPPATPYPIINSAKNLVITNFVEHKPFDTNSEEIPRKKNENESVVINPENGAITVQINQQEKSYLFSFVPYLDNERETEGLSNSMPTDKQVHWTCYKKQEEIPTSFFSFCIK